VGKRVAGSDTATRRRGSHRAAPSKGHGRAVGVGALAVLLIVGGVFVATRFLGSQDEASSDSDANCGASGVTIATTPGLAAPLRSALRDRGCTKLLVEPIDPGDVATALVSGTDVPDYWIPDSPLWVDRVAETTGTTPRTLVESVASTPVVLASASDGAPDTWLTALAAPDLLLGDPLEDGSSAAPLLLATGGVSDSESVSAIAPQAQKHAAAAAAPEPELGRLQTIDTANAGYTPVTEQSVVISGRNVTATVPKPGTWMLTFPLVETATGDRAGEIEDTTKLLTRFATSEALDGFLASSKFRLPNGKPVAGGVGDVKLIPLPQPEAFDKLLSSWTTLAVPSRTLAVIDVSGSMDFASDEGTRIDLTVAATRAGLDLFPNGASVGLWAFSQESDGKLGGHQDYLEIVPIRRLDAYVAGRTQREELGTKLGTLPGLTDGGTALYDTTLAAYQQMRDTYDPTAVNSVLLFSDGANDDPGSSSLDELKSRLEQLADPERPVSIITIGISEDADADALGRIAEATGGFRIVARQPEDMSALFQKAMAARFS
jgi:hypothetical protein